ncbi:hypothetical protein NliqN6_3370 [Naganishia liquefaciens]|uniref:Uncharacterized protein n=1 Tax=Naganishia liquefaciens TaxID=104408 RepID=A0A8H3TTS5_9TREE|nr:hypothetical protein NliqN6_3370 [Naganishia liquefaciens]
MPRRFQNRKPRGSGWEAESAISRSISTSTSAFASTSSDSNPSLGSIPNPKYIEDASLVGARNMSLAETSQQPPPTSVLSELFGRLRAETLTSDVYQTAGGKSLSGNATADSVTTSQSPFACRDTSTSNLKTENLLSSYNIKDLQRDASDVGCRDFDMARFRCVFDLLRQCMKSHLRNYQDYTLKLNDKETLWHDQDYKQMIPPRNSRTIALLTYALRTMARIILVLIERYKKNSKEVEEYKSFHTGHRTRLSADIKQTESRWSDQHEPLPNLWNRLQWYWLSFPANTEKGRQMSTKYQRSYRARHAEGNTGQQASLARVDSELSNGYQLTSQLYLDASPEGLLNILRKWLADMQAASSETQQTQPSALNTGIIIQRLGLTGDHTSSLEDVVMPLIQKRIAEEQEGALHALLGFFWTVLSGQVTGRLADPVDLEDEEYLFSYWIQAGSEWLEKGWSISQLETSNTHKSEQIGASSCSDSEEQEDFEKDRSQ